MHIQAFARRHSDLLLAGSLAAVLTTEVALWEPADHRLAIPAALIGTMGLSLRRRLPLVAFLLAWAGTWGLLTSAPGIDGASAGFVALFFISIYSLGRHTRGLEAWLGGAFALAYMAAFVHTDVGFGDLSAADAAFVLAFVGGPWIAGTAVRIRRDREQSLHVEKLQAVEDERARIARELHDVVSHAIAVTVLQARGARRMLGVDDDRAREALDAIEQTNTQALSDMRRLLSLMRQAEGVDTAEGLAPQPSLDRLDLLVDRVRQSGLDVDLQVSGNPNALPPGLDLSAYRIIQEGLTNVLKHADSPAHADVEVRFGDAGLDVVVRNRGSYTPSGNGHGLIGIRERVSVLGGTVEAGPQPDGSFVLHAHLPYGVEAPA